MKIGLVGYQGSGKSTLFGWLTGVPADPALAHTTQSAMATVPDDRIEPLFEIYHPKKVTKAALEIVDTPGLTPHDAGAPSHAGNAARLSMIREAGCLVPPRDARALAKAISDILSEPGRADRMGRNARRRIQRAFRWSEAAAELAAIFEETIRAAHRRSRAT